MATLVEQYRYALTSISSVLAGIVSSTRLVPGASVKVSLSPSGRLFSSPVFFPARHLVSSSLVMILLPSSSSTSHSVAGVAIFMDGPAPLPLQCTGNLASVMALHLALGRAFSLFGRLCPVDHASPRPPVTASIFRLSSAGQSTWSNWCASALHALFPSRTLPRVGISPGSLRPRHSIGGSPEKSVLVCTVIYATDSAPWSPMSMVSSLTSSLTTSSQSWKTPCAPLTFLPLLYVFRVLLVGAMTTPPHAVPLVTCRALPLLP